MKTIFVVPAAGVLVRNPELNYAPLPAEGLQVVATPYWYGQARDGAVTVRDKAPAAEKPARPPRPSKSERE